MPVILSLQGNESLETNFVVGPSAQSLLTSQMDSSRHCQISSSRGLKNDDSQALPVFPLVHLAEGLHRPQSTSSDQISSSQPEVDVCHLCDSATNYDEENLEV